MKKIIFLLSVLFCICSASFSQTTNPNRTSPDTTNLFSRLSVEAGVNLSVPIYDTYDEYDFYHGFTFCASVYGKIYDRYSAFINYSYLGVFPEKKSFLSGIPVDEHHYYGLGGTETINVGLNYLFEKGSHIPYIEAGAGVYYFKRYPEKLWYKSEYEYKFGFNLGAGYRFVYDKKIGIFVKSKYHHFFYRSASYNFINFSGGIFVKL